MSQDHQEIIIVMVATITIEMILRMTENLEKKKGRLILSSLNSWVQLSLSRTEKHLELGIELNRIEKVL